MGYASLDERAIERGVRTLKEILDSLSAKEPAKIFEAANIYQEIEST